MIGLSDEVLTSGSRLAKPIGRRAILGMFGAFRLVAVIASIGLFQNGVVRGAEHRCWVIVGDSTVADRSSSSVNVGWGQFVSDYLKPSVRVVNAAHPGASSTSFLREHLWEQALLNKPNVVLIQFGHNDCAPPVTDPATTFRDNLRHFIDAAHEAGAEPILVTPVHMTMFWHGRLVPDVLEPYAAATAEVAKEKKVRLVDLHTSSGQLLSQIGAERAAEYKASPTDDLHFSEKGAKAMAALVMGALAEQGVRADLREP